MKFGNKGIKTKVVGAVKFFFTGDEEVFDKAPSSAMEIPIDRLDMVTGGDAATESYLHELSVKILKKSDS